MMRCRPEKVNRRRFLKTGAAFAIGTLFGMQGLPQAFGAHPADARNFRPKISLIIDDIGYSRAMVHRFLGLGVPITFSILPLLKKSHDLALEIADHGHEIMLHQPMEPYDSTLDPGPGALYVGYAPDRIAHIVEKNITAVPLAVGVNNHMGSKFTANSREINDALKVVKNRGLFFVDSVTSNQSKAYQTARSLRMTAASRNIFLDNTVKESAILFQLSQLEQYARKNGRAVGIGHPFPQTARAIARFLKDRPERVAALVHISRVLSY